MTSLQDILQAVADGTIDPQRASELIGDLRRDDTLASGTELQTVPVQRLLIKATGARLVVVGDPAVAEAVAEGGHRMERQGDTLVVTTNLAEGDYETNPQGSSLLNWLTSVVDRVGQALTVRVNPSLPLQVVMVGGTVDVREVAAGTTIAVEAGSARIEGGHGPLNVDVISGSARIDWTFSGDSRVRADMGSATVLVRAESDVRVTAEAALGQSVVKTDTGLFKAVGEGAATAPVTVGAGSGTLHAVARMGSVAVTVQAQ